MGFLQKIHSKTVIRVQKHIWLGLVAYGWRRWLDELGINAAYAKGEKHKNRTDQSMATQYSKESVHRKRSTLCQGF